METYSKLGPPATVYDSMDYLPYGEQIAGGSGSTHKFTGKERDSESNLDNFPARYFESNSGRWMSPDWSPKPTTVPYAKLGDPQTLNLYSYLRNNPLNAVDGDGHTSDPCKDNKTSCTVTTNDKDKTATITQTTSTTVISKDKEGNEISTSTTTTTSLTVSTADKTNGQILGGSTTVTTAVSNLTLLTEGTTTKTTTTTLNPEQANKAVGADKVEKLQSFVNTSPSHRLATPPVTAGGIVVGAGGGIACAIAEPCGAIAVLASLLGGERRSLGSLTTNNHEKPKTPVSYC